MWGGMRERQVAVSRDVGSGLGNIDGHSEGVGLRDRSVTGVDDRRSLTPQGSLQVECCLLEIGSGRRRADQIGIVLEIFVLRVGIALRIGAGIGYNSRLVAHVSQQGVSEGVQAGRDSGHLR